jgi:hypothetical protein
MPVKDCEKNLMIDGFFGQLVQGTIFLGDETPLESGTINKYGVMNIQVLTELLETRPLP